MDRPGRGARERGLDLLAFAWHEALSCLFGVGIVVGLALTSIADVGVPRYDAMLAICVLLQIAMVASGLETPDELRVIALFHLLGLGLEIYKVHVGSWTYADAGHLRIADVPIYSGFMYAAVASYITQAWRRLALSVDPVAMAPILAVSTAMYLNFFTNNRAPDVRWILIAIAAVLLRRTWIRFALRGAVYRMPLLLSFALIGFFVWVAENIATLFGAWTYPSQRDQWTFVHPSKIGSWMALVIFSFVLVLWFKQLKERRSGRRSGAAPARGCPAPASRSAGASAAAPRAARRACPPTRT